MQPGEFVAFQVPCQELQSTSLNCNPQDPPRRTKRYALRSKNGCVTCRRRRIRCDEKKPPPCRNCEKAQVSCSYAPPPVTKNLQNASTSSELIKSVSSSLVHHAPIHPFTEPLELSDLHFWTEIGGCNMGKWHSPSFYERLLPQFSWLHESVKFAMLAMSTCVRQWHVTSDEERDVLLSRGTEYYSKACRELLKPTDGSRASIEAALVSSLTLFGYDSFTDHMDRRYVHSNASLSLLRLLKQGLTWNEVSGWRSQFGKVGTQIVIEIADTYLNDISYPLFAASRGSGVNMLDASAPGRSRLYNPMWLKLDPRLAIYASETSDMQNIMTIEPPSQSWVLVEVTPTSVEGCEAHMTAWHCWLLTWLITIASSPVELCEYQSLSRQWHQWLFTGIRPEIIERQVMQNRAAILDRLFDARIKDCLGDRASSSTIEDDLNCMLRLVSMNLDLFRKARGLSSTGVVDTAISSTIGSIRGLAKVVEYVIRRTGSNETKKRAYGLLSLKYWDGATAS